MAEHALVRSASTQYIVLETAKPKLRKLIEDQMAFVFDLKDAHIDELLETGETHTTDMLTKREKVITLEFCDCDNPQSHVRS